MSSEHDTNPNQSEGQLDPSAEEGVLFLVSRNPNFTCPKCGAGEEYKKAMHIDYGVPEGSESEERVYMWIAIECDSCGLFDKSVIQGTPTK